MRTFVGGDVRRDGSRHRRRRRCSACCSSSAWSSRGGRSTGREFRRRAAMPVGLLVGALALLLITGVRPRRPRDVPGEEPLPPPRRRDDPARARRRRRRGDAARGGCSPSFVIALLVVGIPGNLNVIVNYMHRGDRHEPGRVQADDAVAPPRAGREGGAAPTSSPSSSSRTSSRSAGCSTAWPSGRIPKPSTISPADEAMDTLRLSFRQAPGELAARRRLHRRRAASTCSTSRPGSSSSCARRARASCVSPVDAGDVRHVSVPADHARRARSSRPCGR